MIRIAFMGDVNLAWAVSKAAERHGPAYPWGDTLPLLRGADLRILNLECAISERGRPFQPKRIHMKAAPGAVDVLREARIDVVGLANNHVLDFGVDALADTIAALDAAGIRHTGAGMNLAEAAAPATVEAAGLKVAVAALTDTVVPWAATARRPGVNFVPLWAFPQMGQLWSWRFRLFAALEPLVALRARLRWRRIQDKLRQQIQDPDFRSADLRVLSCHFGPNWRGEPAPYYRRFARAAIDGGVHVYHGHSAHLPQGIEVLEGAPVLYDTGDFVDPYGALDGHRNDLSFLYMLSVDEGTRRPVVLELVPVRISANQVNLAGAADAKVLLAAASRQCADLGTVTRRQSGCPGMRIDLS